FLLILGSYVAIVRTVLRVPTARGRLKALSTCSSHLAAIIIFYIPGFFTYLQPPGGGSQGWVKGVAVCYSVLIPALNPLVYSLRNQEVK
ncbi:O1440 protein, partial [Upupa epops]|nr:O1440 protein [Upupa epops]